MRKQGVQSLYQVLGEKVHGPTGQKESLAEKIEVGKTVRCLRTGKGLSGAELCRRAGDLNPKTLTAVERGRIKNPSVRTLVSLARGLGVTVSDLFRQAEMSVDRYFCLGSQKGVYRVDFPQWGVKAVSFTPFIPDFFCGKFILAPRSKFTDTLLGCPGPIHLSTLVGRFEIEVEDRVFELKEGENIFLNGILRHSFYNPMHRESVLMVVTAPSFFARSGTRPSRG